MRCLGHGSVMLGSPNKDKGFGNWSLIYLLPTEAEQGFRETPHDLSGKVKKKQKHLACITNSIFLHLRASQLNICSWMRKSGSPYGGHLARQADQLGSGQPDIRWLIRSQDILGRWPRIRHRVLGKNHPCHQLQCPQSEGWPPGNSIKGH